MLVAACGDDGDACGEAGLGCHLRRKAANRLAGVDEVAEAVFFDPKEFYQLIIPVPGVEVEEVGAACQGAVGDKSAGQAVDEVVLDSDEFVAPLIDIWLFFFELLHFYG